MLLELERKEKLVLEVGGKRRSRKRTATRKRKRTTRTRKSQRKRLKDGTTTRTD